MLLMAACCGHNYNNFQSYILNVTAREWDLKKAEKMFRDVSK